MTPEICPAVGAALEKAADDVIRIAEAEGLTAHANSIKVRF